MDTLLSIVLYPGYVDIRVTTAVLWPTDRKEIKQTQLACLIAMVLGLLASAATVAALYFGLLKLSLGLFVAAGLLLFTADCIGDYVENKLKPKR